MSKSFTSPPLDRRRLGQLAWGSLLGAVALPVTWAQAPATQATLRLVVPFTPGTGIDLVARQIGPPLSERLKRAVFVENRPGASGNIGTQDVVRSAPDGNTLLVSVNTLVMNPALFPRQASTP